MNSSSRPVFPLLIAFFLGVIVATGVWIFSQQMMPAPIVIQPPPPTATPAPIKVFVNGAVNLPGVYELPLHSRVEEAVRLAGGVTASADLRTLNLAALLSDGAQLYVATTDQNDQAAENSGAFLLNNSASAEATSTNAKIDLNTATLAELETLPGVGPSTAQKILSYREDVGRFNQIEDVMNVSGIGEAKFATMRDFITVSP